jgi:hypothetical protein
MKRLDGLYLFGISADFSFCEDGALPVQMFPTSYLLLSYLIKLP